jgi:hypothetical protein
LRARADAAGRQLFALTEAVYFRFLNPLAASRRRKSLWRDESAQFSTSRRDLGEQPKLSVPSQTKSKQRTKKARAEDVGQPPIGFVKQPFFW